MGRTGEGDVHLLREVVLAYMIDFFKLNFHMRLLSALLMAKVVA